MSVPILYKEKSQCCGCGACGDVCSKGAISFFVDEQGFMYPEINEEKCIECEMCLRVCPFK